MYKHAFSPDAFQPVAFQTTAYSQPAYATAKSSGRVVAEAGVRGSVKIKVK